MPSRIPLQLLLRIALANLALLSAIGCGGGTQAPVIPLTITAQPASQTIPLGSTGTFNVSASGPATIGYQWSENGVPIQGATQPSYTTSSITAADSGEVFSVSLSSGRVSLESNPATLTVGPRSPAAGDLRFQQVDAPTTINGYQGSTFTFLLGRFGLGFGNQTGTPLGLGPNTCDPSYTTAMGCAWPIDLSFVPTGVPQVDTKYTSNVLESFDTNLTPILSDPNVVLTSVDINERVDAYAASYVTTYQNGGFDLHRNSVSPSALAGAAAMEGTQGRVITGVTFQSGQVQYFAYGWSADTISTYETTTILTSFDGIPAQAENFAGEGYILTALGGNDADGYVLIGTRVKGDTIARPIRVVPEGQQLAQLQQKPGYAIVGFLLDAQENLTFIGEQ